MKLETEEISLVSTTKSNLRFKYDLEQENGGTVH